MRQQVPQNFANHRRILPLYHFVMFGIFLINAIWSIVQLIRYPSWTTILACAVAVALLGLFFYAREFALRVQDRVIRLEMRLRLTTILPADLRGRIPELDRDQLIALRFASDAELPDLVREVLTNDIRRRDEIKRNVKKWEADHWRV
jgi:uncharacterized protein DUF6526